MEFFFEKEGKKDVDLSKDAMKADPVRLKEELTGETKRYPREQFLIPLLVCL